MRTYNTRTDHKLIAFPVILRSINKQPSWHIHESTNYTQSHTDIYVKTLYAHEHIMYTHNKINVVDVHVIAQNT